MKNKYTKNREENESKLVEDNIMVRTALKEMMMIILTVIIVKWVSRSKEADLQARVCPHKRVGQELLVRCGTGRPAMPPSSRGCTHTHHQNSAGTTRGHVRRGCANKRGHRWGEPRITENIR